jgi:hypothetical protein
LLTLAQFPRSRPRTPSPDRRVADPLSDHYDPLVCITGPLFIHRIVGGAEPGIACVRITRMRLVLSIVAGRDHQDLSSTPALSVESGYDSLDDHVLRERAPTFRFSTFRPPSAETGDGANNCDNTLCIFGIRFSITRTRFFVSDVRVRDPLSDPIIRIPLLRRISRRIRLRITKISKSSDLGVAGFAFGQSGSAQFVGCRVGFVFGSPRSGLFIGSPRRGLRFRIIRIRSVRRISRGIRDPV